MEDEPWKWDVCGDVDDEVRNRASKGIRKDRDLFYSLHEEVLSVKSFSAVIKVVAVAAAYRTLLPGVRDGVCARAHACTSADM